MSTWIDAVRRLRSERRRGVLVTVSEVRGHAPREAGAKLVVALDTTWGSVGGGNLEQTAIAQARAMIETGAREPVTTTTSLSDRAHTEHGRQCCGGKVTLLFEPLPVVPAIAIFGMGHVGLEIARILSRHDVELHLVDSRAAEVTPERLTCLDQAVAGIHARHAPLPEVVLGEVPPGTHVLVLTHDHAEDFAICDAALRCGHLGSIGLIGSSAKWQRFRRGLLLEGWAEADADRIRTPIGGRGPGKEPATIALRAAAELLDLFTADEAVPEGSRDDAARSPRATTGRSR